MKKWNGIPYKKLELSHLQNIIKWIEKRAKDGWIVRNGGGTCPDDFWYDEEEISGDEVKEYFGYETLKEELNARGKEWEKYCV